MKPELHPDVQTMVAKVQAIDPVVLKQRLLDFLHWPCHDRGLLYEWEEVVSELIGK